MVASLHAKMPLALGPKWLEAEFLIETFGLLGILSVVFVESGLLIGFLLPGDSLLFTAGLLSANGTLPALWVLLVTIPIAAIAGDQVGYAIGRKAGPSVFNRPESRFFRAEYVERSHEFFERHGARAIVLARFVPIVRTLAPVMAGVSRMRYRTFLVYNVIGGLAWGVGVTTLGYFLGQVEFVHDNLEPIILGIVALSVIPIAIELLRARRDSRGSGLLADRDGSVTVEVDGRIEREELAQPGAAGAPPTSEDRSETDRTLGRR